MFLLLREVSFGAYQKPRRLMMVTDRVNRRSVAATKVSTGIQGTAPERFPITSKC